MLAERKTQVDASVILTLSGRSLRTGMESISRITRVVGAFVYLSQKHTQYCLLTSSVVCLRSFIKIECIK